MLPSDLSRLLELGAITRRELDLLHQATGATSAADLASAVRDRRIRSIQGLGIGVEAAIAAALPALRSKTAQIPIGQAVRTLHPVIDFLKSHEAVAFAAPGGALRRGADMLDDLEVVAPTYEPSRVLDALLDHLAIRGGVFRGPVSAYFELDGLQVGVRCPHPDTSGIALLFATGSPAHVDALHALAEDRGGRLDQYGVHVAGHGAIAATEEAIYAALDLPFVPPELREGGDEIGRALAGSLPELLHRGHIRGDLHMHTRWSDGRNSVEEMVQAAIEQGYDYIAITDHSQRSAASHNLTIDDVARQADELAAVRAQYPQIAVLHGCEVDIMPDGSLDFPDHVLERFDIVIASLHDAADHDAARLTDRSIAAMRHPLVSVLTHPTNRHFPHRPGYDLDFERLFAAAVDSGAALEVDGAPSHLDLDASLARRAMDAGVLLAVDSDAHRIDLLGRQMDLAVATARRGWVEPGRVLNTASIDQLRARIQAKRRGTRV